MNDKPIDQKQIHSARQLDEKIRVPIKVNVRRKNYTSVKITKDFPGAWLFVDQVFPESRYSRERRVEEANELIHWHRQNGTLDTLRSTYRGDFYQPEPGSPEEEVHWGDFYNNKSYTRVIAQENAIRDLRRDYTLAEKSVEEAGKRIEENYKKAKAQQYRWKRRLLQINEETNRLLEGLDEHNVSQYMIPVARFDGKWQLNDEQNTYWTELEHPIYRDTALQVLAEEEEILLQTKSFAEVRQIIIDIERLKSLNTQKSDIFKKMDGWEDKQAEIETGLMEDLMVAQYDRDDIKDKLEGLNKNRSTRHKDVRELMKLRNAVVHNSADADQLIDAHAKMGTLSFYDGTPYEAMIKNRLEARSKATSTVMKKTKGTLYEGTITVPPHSTVEIELDDLMAENDAGIETAKEITLKTDALRNEKLEEQQKQRLRDNINTKTVMNIASMLPAAMINASKDIPNSAGGAMRHDMQKLEEWNLVGQNSVQCRAIPKTINGREVEHARSAIALRGGVIVPRDIFLIDVLHHWKTNFYVCQVITHDANKLCALALGVERSGQYAGKLVARTAFYWRPDIWTRDWEASNARVSTEQPGVTLEDLRQEHERLVTKLPMQATDILGMTMNDPATHIAFN